MTDKKTIMSTVKAPKQNPVDKYPQPPYPAQEQQMPGSEQIMDPKPDHGETSYRGTGKLAGRKALIKRRLLPYRPEDKI